MGGSGLTVSVDPSGTYDVSVSAVSWHFTGDVGTPLVNLTTTTGADSLGGYAEISFDTQSGITRHGAIRSYTDRPAVLFTIDYPSGAPNAFSFPNFSQLPRDLDHVTYSGTFAPPSFWYMAPESPWIFFDSSYNTFILSPAANFMAASTNRGAKGELASGIDPQIALLPRGFEHRTLLVIDKGINRTFETWGNALTSLAGKSRPANDADTSLNKIGYWTDNGATYYYQTAASKNYEQTLNAVKADFDRLGIGLGYVQLDSWFYPKGSNALWSNNGQGMYEYVAAAPPFLSGLANFQQRLGVPLITHARWVDASSPYRKSYRMSGNVVIDPAYWDTVAAYLANSGVATYEQDWLNDKAQTDFNLTDGAAFLDNMAASMSARNLTMQYCMASPRHFLQGTKYSNLTTIRTSADRLGRDRWNDFLYTSRLASALGEWPFTDNFNSTETMHLLMATLSAGPVGVGDPIGKFDAVNLLRAVRQDGVIVKPDAALTPIDSSYAAMARGVDAPQIDAAYSDFGGLRTYYLFAYTQGNNAKATFSPADFGAQGRVYVYDYFGRTGQAAAPADAIEKSIAGEALYLIAAPIGPSGIAVLGDTDQFVTMGKKRIASITDDGTIDLTVNFAAGETTRVIRGYAPVHPLAQASVGAVQHLAYDTGSNLFAITIAPGADGTATIRIRPGRAGRPSPSGDSESK